MANELNFYGDPATDSGLTIVARVYNSAGAQVGSDVSCSEVGSLAIYVGSMPSAPAGQYGVRFFAGSEVSPRATGVIEWDGTQEVDPGTEPYPASVQDVQAAERLVQLRENGRSVVRGLTHNRGRTQYELDLNESEVLDVVVDFAPILATAETLSAATAKNSGVSCTVTLASPKATLRFSGLSTNSEGRTELTVTRSGGQVHVLYFLARATESPERSYAYGRIN